MNHLLFTVIADGTPRNTGPDFGKASPVGLLVVILLVIATLLLLRSMNRQLKKVPKSFDRQHSAPDQAAEEGTDMVVETPEQNSPEPPRAPKPDDEPG